MFIKIKIFLFVLQIGMILLPLYSYQFPVKNLRITSVFGESRGDHFHTGIDFGTKQNIYPIEKGEMIFIRDKALDPTLASIGVGNLAVIEHPNQIRSYYFHLEKGSINKEIISVSKKNVIGIMGNSGRSTGNHLHLDIEDDRQNIILNPLILLPFIQDIKKPKITALLVKINDKIYTLKRKSFLKYKGKMQIYLIAMDLRFYFPPKTPINLATGIGIKKLTLKIDNKVVRTYDFSFFKKEKNGLLLSNKYYFKEVYGLKFNYRFGDFMPSKKTHTFKAEVEDWNNNSSVEIYRISFR